MAGLRERKKQRTRDALVRAANELFVSRGYERTTVDDIAAVADVSQRTFFRYFAGKEEVAFAIDVMIQERYVESLKARPPHERPITALRNAVEDSWNSIGEAVARIVPLDLHMRMWHLIETTPALTAVQMRNAMDMEHRLALIIAEREGLDVRADPRPQVLVASFSATMRTAMQSWGQGQDLTVQGAREGARGYLEALSPALFDAWRPAAEEAPPRQRCVRRWT
ncbi:TetR family transcriptional regulator [Streptomyces chumphonensis]|uniref:TetR family transcriptional regulator n=1 Tax=Streptomyces chumphonensis TaxID=1214925 RepID=A0A927EVY7_9ACTN|nr:TetR family transcriptional regulator [Streptomyces chumphonensis]MBD3930566.1 TetR family transcriptional regulator [Streptomyces chumphonensis]